MMQTEARILPVSLLIFITGNTITFIELKIKIFYNRSINSDSFCAIQ